MEAIKIFYRSVVVWLTGLSFKTGVIVLLSCVLFYGLSFASFLLPVSYAAKGVLWATFFGLAKAAQYSGLLILGKEGVKRLKLYLAKAKGRG